MWFYCVSVWNCICRYWLILMILKGYVLIASPGDWNAQLVGILVLFSFKRRRAVETIVVKHLIAIIVFLRLLLWLTQKVHKLLMWCLVQYTKQIGNVYWSLPVTSILKWLCECSLHDDLIQSSEYILITHHVVFSSKNSWMISFVARWMHSKVKLCSSGIIQWCSIQLGVKWLLS